jgi:polyisoprenoid-binding protein YceI
MKDGAESPGSLADKDMKEIEANIQKDVLDAKSHPKVSFASKQVSAGGQVTGTLTLHGSSKEISFGIQKQNGKAVAEVKLNQPDFGIKPFSAMLGTLKIKPELTVRLTVPMS